MWWLHNHHINILAVAVEDQVTYPTANNVAFNTQLIGFLADKFQNRLMYFRVIDSHTCLRSTSRTLRR